MSNKLVPWFARVVLRREQLMKKGSILIPEAMQKKMADTVGRIIAVGPTCDPCVKVGQLVKIGDCAGGWIKIPDNPEDFFICADEDILGVIEEGETNG